MATLPQYRVELNVSGAGQGWLLGQGHLGHSTTLLSAAIDVPMSVVAGFLSASVRRGRNDESGAMETGTATIVMDNANGQFSPDYSASLNFPNVLPMRRIQLSARYAVNAPWTYLFTGFIDSIKPVDNGPVDGNVELGCIDWLGRAARTNITLQQIRQADYNTFAAIVTAVGLFGYPLSYNPPSVTEYVQEINYENVPATQALNDLTDATRGSIFHARDGGITYQTRYDRWQSPGAFSVSYILDQPGLNTAPSPQVVPYTPDGFDYDMNTQSLVNDVTVNATSVPSEGPQSATDATSKSYFGTFSKNYDLPLLDAGRAACLADSLLAAYKTPRARLHSVVIDGDASPAGLPFWDALFALELGNTVRVVKREPAHMSVDRQMFIEGIQHDIRADLGGHTATLQLSDQRQWSPAPWRLGHTPLGTGGTVLIY